MTSQTSVIAPTNSVEGSTATLEITMEERIMQSVRMHYQSNHQEEFLRLQAQIESLMMELNTASVAR